jgi:peptide/nickel transport system substrate-binding protein
LYLNLTYSDTVWNQVVNDLRFRQAINLALNRPEIISSIYFDLASPPETVPGEYNPDEANRLLDEMGLDKRDADGFRLGPDGKTFVIPIEHGAHAPDISPAAELVAENLKSVGLQVLLKKIDSQLWGQRADANDLQATMLWDVQPMWHDDTWNDYLPTNLWGLDWQRWYRTGGKEGQEPPAEVKKLYEIYEGRVQSIPASDDDKKLVNDLYNLYKENLFFIPLAEKVKYALITSSKLGNVPATGQAIAANASLEQMFFKE